MTGLVTFHGPMLLANFPQLTIDNFKRTLFSAEPVGIIKNPENRTPVRSAYPVRTIKSGIAKGGLIGGNLTLVCSLMGTKYEIDTKGKILFIEDVDEEPYKIDRMLTHLKTAGKLQESAAIVFGNCSDCSSSSKLKPSLSWDYSLAEVIDNAFGDLKQPSFYGLTFGHSSTQFTIPYGIEAELNADDCSLNLIESHLT
jgi:muramoyltetrapeptide carboxypeptidase